MLHSATLEQLPRLFAPLETSRARQGARARGLHLQRCARGRLEEICDRVPAGCCKRHRSPRRKRAGALPPEKDFIIRSVLLRGALTQHYQDMPPSMRPLHDAVARLDRLATEAGISLTELAYRYAASFEGLMLVRTAEIGEPQQAIGFVESGPLSADTIAAIRSMPCLEDRFLNPAH
jgi:hypothetical protein